MAQTLQTWNPDISSCINHYLLVSKQRESLSYSWGTAEDIQGIHNKKYFNIITITIGIIKQYNNCISPSHTTFGLLSWWILTHGWKEHIFNARLNFFICHSGWTMATVCHLATFIHMFCVSCKQNNLTHLLWDGML